MANLGPGRLRLASAVLALAAVASTAAPAAAQHRARLSADLDDSVRHGAQAIDVIVEGDSATVAAAAARYNLKVKRVLRAGAVLRVNAGQLAALQEDGAFDHLSSDVRMYAADVTTDAIGAAAVWAGAGNLAPLTGRGVGVAVIDSGVDPKHTALRNRIAASVDFTGGDGIDRYGHGTHVAALIAGQRGVTPDTKDYRGVAPGARIISLRVLGADGSGMASDVIEAIDWAIQNRDRYNIRVINLSLGTPVTQPYRDDPLCEAAERAVSAGIVVVAAAGNHGQTTDGKFVNGSITSPGNDPSVLTVGALDAHATADRTDDTVAVYSGRGPSQYDLVMKPDVMAPGSHLTSAEAPGSYLATTYSARHVAGSGESGYIQLSGTSMAAAVAAGAVAVLLDEKPRLSPSDVKVALQVTSTLMPDAGLIASGAGSLDVEAAAEFVNGSLKAALTSVETAAAPAVAAHASAGKAAQTIVWGQTTIRNQTAVWGKTIVKGQTFTWAKRVGGRHARATRKGSKVRAQSDDDTIVWGSSDDDTIVWGSSDDDTIVWGSSDDDTIVWGSSDDDTIVWGSSDDDTIVWGSSDDDTIVWGSSDDDTIVWGSSDDDTIVWGSSDDDTIVWGSSDDDTIVWGSSDDDTIVWGSVVLD